MTETQYSPDETPTRQIPAQTGVDDDTRAPRKRGGLVVGAILGGLLVLLVGLYVAGYFMAGDKTPKNASVQGVAIGGMLPDQAVAKLKTQLGERFNTPITLSADGKSAKIVPAEAGMTVDFEATVAKAGGGKSWNPVRIWNVLSGGGPLEPQTNVDEKLVAEAVAKIAPTFDAAGKDATIQLTGTHVLTTPGEQKAVLDQQATATLVRDAWLKEDTITVPVAKEDPALTTAEVDAAKADAEKILSGPVNVKMGDKTLKLDAKTLAGATAFQTKDGAVSVGTDMEKLWTSVQKPISDLGLKEGKDASFSFASGRPTVVPSTDGMGVDKAEFIKVVQPALTASGEGRNVEVKVTKKPAKLSTEDANKLGVKEITGEFTTTFPHADYRNTNLSRAAAALNGQLVLPGETFSMNDTLGPRTPANGYVDGYVIQGARLVKETGGGISQSATTVFNAIFFAGLEDVEHHPHTLYFPRYPAGREATLYYGSLDLKFRNNTDYGVVLQAFVNKSSPGNMGSITVRVWSTKIYDVQSTPLNKVNPYDTKPITSNAPDCEPQSASPGFTVNYERLFYKNGALVKREPFTWKYQATPKVTCTSS